MDFDKWAGKVEDLLSRGRTFRKNSSAIFVHQGTWLLLSKCFILFLNVADLLPVPLEQKKTSPGSARRGLNLFFIHPNSN